MVQIGDPYAESPRPSEMWKGLTDEQRLHFVRINTLGKLFPMYFLRAQANGHVIVELRGSPTARERGPLLLSVEAFLRANVEPAILVYLEPMQDRNALRRLRGVKVAE